MLKNNDEKAVLEKIVKWAESKPDIWAVLLTSSRTKPDAELDEFSDYDVIFVADDIKPYRENESWLEEYGKVLVVYRDPIEIRFGHKRFINVTQYENGLKIDFTLWPMELLKTVVKMEQLPDYIDDGYKVLLDKDGLTRGMKAPSCRAYIPKPPTEKEYQTFIENFFHEVTYAAKHIRRHDLFPLMSTLDDMRYTKLCRLLEWKVEIEHNWSLKSGVYGKGLYKYLNQEMLDELESTHVYEGSDIDWKSLYRIILMFSKVAKDVGKRLGFTYPIDLEKRMMVYLQRVKDKEIP
jgi:aminoglycoside 6-adenylyltransferase